MLNKNVRKYINNLCSQVTIYTRVKVGVANFRVKPHELGP